MTLRAVPLAGGALLRTGHTADLEPADLAAVRALLFEVFDDMAGDDWEHCLGGVHAIVCEGDEAVGHGSVVQRRLLHAGAALRTGYVEGVAVRADRRGRGYGGAVMGELERVVRGGYDLGALGSTDEGLGFYGARGWQVWQGRLGALTPEGPVATPDEQGGVLVLTGAVPLDLGGPLTCDWRDGDVW